MLWNKTGHHLYHILKCLGLSPASCFWSSFSKGRMRWRKYVGFLSLRWDNQSSELQPSTWPSPSCCWEFGGVNWPMEEKIQIKEKSFSINLNSERKTLLACLHIHTQQIIDGDFIRGVEGRPRSKKWGEDIFSFYNTHTCVWVHKNYINSVIFTNYVFL